MLFHSTPSSQDKNRANIYSIISSDAYWQPPVGVVTGEPPVGPSGVVVGWSVVVTPVFVADY